MVWEVCVAKRHDRKRSPRKLMRAGAACRRAAAGEREEARLLELLTQERYADGLALAEQILKRSPGSDLAHAARLDCHGQTGATALALEAAIVWTRARPHTLNAWQAQAHCAAAFGATALAWQACQRIEELGGEPPMRTTWEEVDAGRRVPYGPRPSFEETLAGELARLRMGQGDFATATKLLSHGRSVASRNNAALCLFYLQRSDEALHAFEALWREHPADLMALAWMLRLHLASGRREEAADLVRCLAEAEPQRQEDAVAQLKALLLVGQPTAAAEAWRRAGKADWGEILPRLRVELMHLGACALLRCGKEAAAGRLWKKAAKLVPGAPDVAGALRDLERDATQREGAVSESLMAAVPGAAQAMLAGKRAAGLSGPDGASAASRAMAELVGVFAETDPEYLVAQHAGAGRMDRHTIQLVLIFRANDRQQDVLPALRQLLRQRQGSDHERLGLAITLLGAGLLPPDQAFEILWKGRVQEISLPGELVRYAYHREPEPDDFPALHADRRDQAVHALRQGRPEEGLRLLEDLQELYPGDKRLAVNLGAAMISLGHQDEAEALFEQAVEIDPQYVIARSNLARMALSREDGARAGRWMDGLQVPERLHVDDAFALHGTQALVASARGDELQCESWLIVLERIAVEEHERDQIGGLRRMAARLRRPTGGLLGWPGWRAPDPAAPRKPL